MGQINMEWTYHLVRQLATQQLDPSLLLPPRILVITKLPTIFHYRDLCTLLMTILPSTTLLKSLRFPHQPGILLTTAELQPL